MVYRKGIDNGAADALSRREQQQLLLAVSSPVHSWMEALTQWYPSNLEARELLAQLSLDASSRPPFQLRNGLIYYKDRVWLGSNVLLQQQVISALHDSPVGGHSGSPATYQKLRPLFYWPSMKSAILRYVQSCAICSQAKLDRAAYPGLLQPLPVPRSSWEVVSMDFVEGLPLSGSANAILVVVDKFSKYNHFLPLKHPFSASSVARLFMDNIFKLHGMPLRIVSDRDKVFTSRFWQLLFQLSGTELRMSTTYHPQTDGQTERVNQCLETYLRCFAHACPRKWSCWLSLAEFWYNSSYHSSLGRTPFEVLYGFPPRYIGLDIAAASPVPEFSKWLEEGELMHDLVCQHLLRAQARMKKQADLKRSERQFAVGDLVYLKLQPYVQSSVARRAHHKLAFRFFGPYRVLARVGKVAYRLQLPEGAAVHPVFHVSQLKQSAGTEVVSQSLPSDLVEFQVPVKVL